MAEIEYSPDGMTVHVPITGINPFSLIIGKRLVKVDRLPNGVIDFHFEDGKTLTINLLGRAQADYIAVQDTLLN